jgi:hypothetical protein
MSPPSPSSKSTNTDALKRIRAVSHLLDNAIAIPSTDLRVGLDPLLGLFPGGGDGISLFFSVYIVLESLRFGLPKETLFRMIVNLVVDAIVGSVPMIGDLFDFAWKANARNIQLVESHLANPRPQTMSDRLFVWAIALVLILLLVGAIALIVGAIRFLAWLLTGG